MYSDYQLGIINLFKSLSLKLSNEQMKSKVELFNLLNPDIVALLFDQYNQEQIESFILNSDNSRDLIQSISESSTFQLK